VIDQFPQGNRILPLPVRRERVGVRAYMMLALFSAANYDQDPHPVPFPEYQERRKCATS
jgi:hypothetical protein